MSMTKFTTESGAEYVYDDGSHKIVQLDQWGDGYWHPVDAMSKIEVDSRVRMRFTETQNIRTTTPVVSIEEVS